MSADQNAFLARARVRNYSPVAVTRVTGKSFTTHWRRRNSGTGEPALTGRAGVDVVAFMLADRAAAGLPPLAETDILMALEVEEASIAREKAAARAERVTTSLSGVTEATV